MPLLRRFSAALVLMLAAGSLWAQAQVLAEPNEKKALQLIAEIEVGTAEELEQKLQRVGELVDNNGWQYGRDAPVAFLLHGEEARALFRQNYSENKTLVDLAAKLAAFEVIDMRVCETWMGGNRLDKDQLQPFVNTVLFAPLEKKQLRSEGYIDF